MGFLGVAEVGLGPEVGPGRLSKDSLTQHQSGKWWSGVEHLGSFIAGGSWRQWGPASLELQLRGINALGLQRRWH